MISISRRENGKYEPNFPKQSFLNAGNYKNGTSDIFLKIQFFYPVNITVYCWDIRPWSNAVFNNRLRPQHWRPSSEIND